MFVNNRIVVSANTEKSLTKLSSHLATRNQQGTLSEFFDKNHAGDVRGGSYCSKLRSATKAKIEIPVLSTLVKTFNTKNAGEPGRPSERR